MKIEWSITKKRGNLRPVLNYSFVVESFEKELALPPLRVVSSIAEPTESWQEHCYPNQFERAENPVFKDYYNLDIVSHKGNLWPQKIRLAWREDNDYPEVEESFKRLRDAFEKELALAHASKPMEENACLQISDKATCTVAPSVLGQRFLNFAKISRGANQNV